LSAKAIFPYLEELDLFSQISLELTDVWYRRHY
jgi:hypothetical protein